MKAIASKLVKIMGECDYVQKDGTNKFHNYNYASAANVLEKVNAACVKHNVASIPSAKIISVDEVTTSKGNKERLITVETTLTLVDGDSGESLTTISLGTGQDPGDKAVAKAQTMAIKYAWMIALNISTGDDPEADESTDEKMHGAVTRKPAQPTQQPTAKPEQQSIAKPATENKTGYTCSECNTAITQAIHAFSERNHGKPLCQTCQKKGVA